MKMIKKDSNSSTKEQISEYQEIFFALQHIIFYSASHLKCKVV